MVRPNNKDRPRFLILSGPANSDPLSNVKAIQWPLAQALLSALLLLNSLSIAAKPLEPPNIIFVLADDLGWAELGCYGNTFNETPHLDRLASKGMRFTQAYAAAPVCSPYRAAFLTGQYPARIGISDYLRPNSANALSTEHTSLAEALKAAGYATGMIGKWHLSGYERHNAEFEIRPKDHGFDWDFARELKGVSNGVNFWPYLDRKQKRRWLDIPENRLGSREFLVDRMNDEAVLFIERNKDRPFFLYLSHYATHSIVHGKPELVEKYRRKHVPGESSKTRCVICSGQGLEGCPLHHWASSHNPHLAAMLESIDNGIGLITQKLDELGLSHNTILIFTSDNGGETNVTSNAPLRGGKSQLYEGGIRVPLIVCWPSQIPASTTNRGATMNIDFYPTLLEAAGESVPADQRIDGVSTLAHWKAPSAQLDRQTLYWHYPLDRPHFLGGVSASAIRDGDWKLIQFLDDDTHELYSLRTDPSEEKNIADQHPSIVHALRNKLAEWQHGVQARTPSPPILTEMRQLRLADHFSSAKASKQWTFSKDSKLTKGHLRLNGRSKGASVLHLPNATVEDLIIRFDFQLHANSTLRLELRSEQDESLTLEIGADGFRLRTPNKEQFIAADDTQHTTPAPLRTNRWYSMTLECLDKHFLAHVDQKTISHVRAHSKKAPKDQLVFTAERGTANIDNIQVFGARTKAGWEDTLTRLLLE